MPADHESKTVCPICSRQKPSSRMVPGHSIRPGITALIQQDHPEWTTEASICLEDLDEYRARYVQGSLEAERGELTKIEADVLHALQENETIARDLNKEFDSTLSLGDRAADKVAEFGGSWKFIGIFGSVLFVWILLNSWLLATRAFDPYPFILLNLVLSCIAAIQAPIIMMSQNRQADKDRLRAEHDYRVNLKAEVEIRNLHEKVDHLLQNQWQRLLEIQEIQTDLIREIAQRSPARN